VSTQSQAQGKQPLPALPDPAIIYQIIAVSESAMFTPLTAPPASIDNLKGNASSAKLVDRIDTGRAVSAIGLDGGLTRTITPLRNAATTKLQADSQTPDDQRPATVIGTIYEPTKGTTTVIMAVYDSPGSAKPSAIRFYSPDNKQLPDGSDVTLVMRTLKGDGSGAPAQGDQGVIIAARETCYTVGLDQVCYATKKYAPNQKVVAQITQAAQQVTAAYDFKMDFDLDGALTEVWGSSLRLRCAGEIGKGRGLPTAARSACTANLIFTASTQIEDGQPIGLFRILQNTGGLKVYRPDGTPASSIPAGSYLVLNATPSDRRNQPGAAGALFLVNANGKDHFLIPAQVDEGFGASGDPTTDARRGQAGIKDGFISGVGF
jgi:hypothetical protein